MSTKRKANSDSDDATIDHECALYTRPRIKFRPNDRATRRLFFALSKSVDVRANKRAVVETLQMVPNEWVALYLDIHDNHRAFLMRTIMEDKFLGTRALVNISTWFPGCGCIVLHQYIHSMYCSVSVVITAWNEGSITMNDLCLSYGVYASNLYCLVHNVATNTELLHDSMIELCKWLHALLSNEATCNQLLRERTILDEIFVELTTFNVLVTFASNSDVVECLKELSKHVKFCPKETIATLLLTFGNGDTMQYLLHSERIRSAIAPAFTELMDPELTRTANFELLCVMLQIQPDLVQQHDIKLMDVFANSFPTQSSRWRRLLHTVRKECVCTWHVLLEQEYGEDYTRMEDLIRSIDDESDSDSSSVEDTQSERRLASIHTYQPSISAINWPSLLKEME